MQHSRQVLVNSLATGDAGVVRDALSSMIDQSEPPGVSASLAHVLAGAIAPVMVWGRDARRFGCPLHTVPSSFRFEELFAMAEGAPPAAGPAGSRFDWTGLPCSLKLNVMFYLFNLPGLVDGTRAADVGHARECHTHTQRVLCLALL